MATKSAAWREITIDVRDRDGQLMSQQVIGEVEDVDVSQKILDLIFRMAMTSPVIMRLLRQGAV